MAKESFEILLKEFHRSKQLILEEISRHIVGQRDVVEQMLAAILTRGHCLLVGVPGLAKTLMVSTLARITSLSFKRIQFTPDLMPSDITGTNVIDELPDGRREFRFVRGPVFANIVLADEINRTPPKTQAALLQAMQEREVTSGSQTWPLPNPFFVIATQNPIEQEGTYPLPEAQLDRFMFSVWVDYPSLGEEQQILARTTGAELPPLRTVMSDRQVLNMQKLIAAIPATEYVIDYAAAIVRASRPSDATAPDFVKKYVDWGAGPRAGQFLIWAGKAMAAMDARYSVSIADIRKMAIPVLRHRIACNFAAQAAGLDSVKIIQKLIEHVPEPEIPRYETKPPAEVVQE
ncbi:MAG: MoxR family ATPase [Phycisphaerae bacterium]|jgi:MoxR-like ATPase|nr:MoxR family ATPase [Phycisphaerae bacterium]HOO16653.1 MoxR family ATPase [Phycisphaerae bacterium]HRS28901.1 MoxR family ATPase [Phycisphaerae bacterium]